MATMAKNILRNKSLLRKAASTNSFRIHVLATKNGWAVKKEGLK